MEQTLIQAILHTKLQCINSQDIVWTQDTEFRRRIKAT